ncbi:MAG: iron chelate uptake ABC transporter family permease subunit [Bacteroidota bacterium]
MIDDLFYLPASMLWPLVACLVLTGIHVYLGVHVIARKVIFVDLALAQIAALGTVIGVLLGYEAGKDTTQLYLYSLTFTIFGAFIFSVTKMKGEKVPHEAIIGIVYAVTFAATILILSRSALGPQELDHIIKGELLWVQAPTVIKTALIYACVGAFHFVFRKHFMAISFNPESAEASGTSVRLWDFLFYMSFGFVITSSVAIAGVFLVFSYLVIPAVGAMLLSERLSTRLTIGWVAGSVISFIGVKLSYATGLPTSPLIVVVLALALIASAVVRYVRMSPKKMLAVRNILASCIVAGIFVAGVILLRKPQEDPLEHDIHMLVSKMSTERLTALSNLESHIDQKGRWLASVLEKLSDEDAQVRKGAIELLTKVKETGSSSSIAMRLDDRSDEVRKAAAEALGRIGGRLESQKLVDAAAKEEDEEMKVEFLKTALELGNPNAVVPLISVLKQGSVFADDAYDAIRGHVQFEFRKNEGEKLLRWWGENAQRIQWEGGTKTFHKPR